jgi:23S rRNA (guanosine2251-2'-O)-methyltransferase
MVQYIFVSSEQAPTFIQTVRRLAKAARLPMSLVGKKDLARRVGNGVNDQGIAAQLSHFPYMDMHQWLDMVPREKRKCVVMLDELQDPHNVGAIIRSCVAFGAQAVLLPTHRQSPITNVVVKTSAGLVWHIPIIKVGNVNSAVKELKKEGFWSVALAGEANETIGSISYDMPTLLVVGNEGSGVRKLTQEICDFVVKIPMEGVAESLNASVALSVAMYEWKRQQKK